MIEKRYMISDAARKVDVEPHVLRHWEEEIGISVSRNELGHRYYKKEDISVLRTIKKLKDTGFQLKAIKLLLPDLNRVEALDPLKLVELRTRLDKALCYETVQDTAAKNTVAEVTAAGVTAAEVTVAEVTVPPQIQDKMMQFRGIMHEIISETMVSTLANTLSSTLTDTLQSNNKELTSSISGEIELLLQLREEREEERFRTVDRLIREHQLGNERTAATKENLRPAGKRKESKFFKKYHVHI